MSTSLIVLITCVVVPPVIGAEMPVAVNGSTFHVVFPERTSEFSTIGPVSVPVGYRDLAVHFAAAWLRDPAVARFEYRLIGADERWRMIGADRSVGYADLAPGSYRFEVRVGRNFIDN